MLVFEGDERLELKITDFGVSKCLDDSSGWWSAEWPFLGDYEYMSSESVTEGEVSGSS